MTWAPVTSELEVPGPFACRCLSLATWGCRQGPKEKVTPPLNGPGATSDQATDLCVREL